MARSISNTFICIFFSWFSGQCGWCWQIAIKRTQFWNCHLQSNDENFAFLSPIVKPASILFPSTGSGTCHGLDVLRFGRITKILISIVIIVLQYAARHEAARNQRQTRKMLDTSRVATRALNMQMRQSVDHCYWLLKKFRTFSRDCAILCMRVLSVQWRSSCKLLSL